MAHHGRDFLYTVASRYWLTNTIGSSVRIYKEHFGDSPAGTGGLACPARPPAADLGATAVAVAPKDVVLVPRAAVAEPTDPRRWRVMPASGHFLPAGRPVLLATGYRAFFAETCAGR